MKQNVYVVKHFHKPLLGRPAIECLDLFAGISNIKKTGQSPMDQFSHLFSGLGRLEEKYTIKLQDGAKPFANLSHS